MKTRLLREHNPIICNMFIVVVIVIGCIHLPCLLILSLASIEKDKESLFTVVNSIILPALGISVCSFNWVKWLIPKSVLN